MKYASEKKRTSICFISKGQPEWTNILRVCKKFKCAFKWTRWFLAFQEQGFYRKKYFRVVEGKKGNIL